MIKHVTGRVEDVLPKLPADSFHAVLCDPPYGLGFMSKTWDKEVPGVEVWREVYRVLKPGAFGLVFGGTRTFPFLALALVEAGFELRDTLCWLYGSGFPKNHNILKAIDKAAGAEREVVGRESTVPTRPITDAWDKSLRERTEMPLPGGGDEDHGHVRDVTAPATEEAARWEGYGTALKPAWEPILLIRKPPEGTNAENCVKWGTGALNIDGGRVETDWNEPDRPDSWKRSGHSAKPNAKKIAAPPGKGIKCHPAGRWPANLVLQHTPECKLRGVKRVKGVADGIRTGGIWKTGGIETPRKGHADPDGLETVDDWDCSPECPVRLLNEQSKKDAARFFYCAKSSPGERNAGCAGLEKRNPFDRNAVSRNFEGAGSRSGPRQNYHPTLKPLDLCRYLATLLLPPESDTPHQILVPFSGSGSEMIGAYLAGWDTILGIEAEEEYNKISKARCAYWERFSPGTSVKEALKQAKKERKCSG